MNSFLVLKSGLKICLKKNKKSLANAMNREYNQFVTAMKCEVADTPTNVVMKVCWGIRMERVYNQL